MPKSPSHSPLKVEDPPMKDSTAIIVQTECSECDVRVHWKVVDVGPGKAEWEPLDASSGFVCPHWRDHHQAAFSARDEVSSEAHLGPVIARVLTKNAF